MIYTMYLTIDFRILQESLIALKTILKEIDPFAFEEALRMNA